MGDACWDDVDVVTVVELFCTILLHLQSHTMRRPRDLFVRGLSDPTLTRRFHAARQSLPEQGRSQAGTYPILYSIPRFSLVLLCLLVDVDLLQFVAPLQHTTTFAAATRQPILRHHNHWTRALCSRAINSDKRRARVTKRVPGTSLQYPSIRDLGGANTGQAVRW